MMKPTETPLPDLTAEYEAWLASQALPRMSADELLHEVEAPDQRAWLTVFSQRWEATAAMIDELRADGRALDTGHDPDLVRELMAAADWLEGPQLAPVAQVD